MGGISEIISIFATNDIYLFCVGAIFTPYQHGDEQMKTYTKEINGVTVTAYNDSNVDWVVTVNGSTAPWPRNKFTMKQAMENMVEIFGGAA